jgi:hippurate hydrolase
MHRFTFALITLFTLNSQAQNAETNQSLWMQQQSSNLLSTYQYLHSNPELSTQEKNTSAYLQSQIKALGFEIVPLSSAFYSFAAVMKNGQGKTIFYRTDMDGLPVQEKTGLEYASKAMGVKDGLEVPVMHACGHDYHMTVWLAIAKYFATHKKEWSGTLVLLAQSAEEIGKGARAVIESKEFASIPKADYQLAIHDNAELQAGVLGFCDGYSMAAVNMMDITIFGKGGHGAQPQSTIDPVVLASQYVLAIQTIVSRNLPPTEPAVITVGSIKGGSAGNVIPDMVQLKLTIRSFTPEAKQLIFDRLKQIGNNLALAAGLDSTRFPKFDLLDQKTPPVYNDPAMGQQLREILGKNFGKNSYQSVKPVMIGEDFGEFMLLHPETPSYIIWAGTIAEEKKALANEGKISLPSLHSAGYAPQLQAVTAASVQLILLLGNLFVRQ